MSELVYGHSLSLILLDVDFFKSYNDTYSHQSGDRALIEIAKAIRDIVQRPGDLVARYGGEELAVILPNTDLLGSTEVGQKIYFAIQRLAIPHQNSLVSSHLTLSAGLATVIPKPGSNFEEIIAAADKALYQAKSAGRDCFEHNNLLLEAKQSQALAIAFAHRVALGLSVPEGLMLDCASLHSQSHIISIFQDMISRGDAPEEPLCDRAEHPPYSDRTNNLSQLQGNTLDKSTDKSGKPGRVTTA